MKQARPDRGDITGASVLARAYENFCIGVFTVHDGRIRAVREYMDTL